MAVPLLLAGASIAANLAPLVKPAIGIAKRFLQRSVARPGIGSKVTSGKLKLGGKSGSFTTARPGTGYRIAGAAAAAGAAGLGVATVASHRRQPSQREMEREAREWSEARYGVPGSRTRTKERKCCPVGTKRIVCYKRGRVKARLGSKASKWKRKGKADARARTRKLRSAKRRGGSRRKRGRR